MTTSTPAPSTVDAIDALLRPLVRNDTPGAVIGINLQGRPLYRGAFGLASIEHGVANTPRTRMRIASTSKQFTALAIMLLAEDGKLSIDDPVQQHLPELPRLAASGPTLRQLMNHTSGWRGHDEMWAIANGFTLQPQGTSLAMMARQSELNSEPGKRMIYSNGTYHMLALIVERLSGSSFGDFLKTRVFQPLGMFDTESVASDLDVRPGLATLYIRAPGSASGYGSGWRRGLYPAEIEGGGSLVSTLDDMLRWLAHLRSADKIVGSPDTWAQMLASTTLASGEVTPYGFGLIRHPYLGTEVIHHNGAVIGGTSQMITVPEHDLDIMIMANGAPAGPAALALKLIELLLAGKLSGQAEPRAAASDFPGLVGQRYHAPASGHLVRFAQAGDRLALSWLGSPPVPLRQREGMLWIGVLDLAIGEVEIDLEGADTSQTPDTLALREGGDLQQLRRLPETPPEAAAFAPAVVGSYLCSDLDASARITLEDGALMLAIQGRHGRMVSHVQPLSDDVATIVPLDALIAAVGTSCVLNIDRRDGQVVGLRLDSVRSRHVRFTREETGA